MGYAKCNNLYKLTVGLGTEYLKQTRGAVSAMLFYIHRLRDAAEYLYEDLDKRLEDSGLTSAELHEAVYGTGGASSGIV